MGGRHLSCIIWMELSYMGHFIYLSFAPLIYSFEVSYSIEISYSMSSS